MKRIKLSEAKALAPKYDGKIDTVIEMVRANKISLVEDDNGNVIALSINEGISNEVDPIASDNFHAAYPCGVAFKYVAIAMALINGEFDNARERLAAKKVEAEPECVCDTCECRDYCFGDCEIEDEPEDDFDDIFDEDESTPKAPKIVDVEDEKIAERVADWEVSLDELKPILDRGEPIKTAVERHIRKTMGRCLKKGTVTDMEVIVGSDNVARAYGLAFGRKLSTGEFADAKAMFNE